MTESRPRAGRPLSCFLLFAAALFVVCPAEASRTTTDARSLVAPSPSLELLPPAPADPAESSPRFGFGADLTLLDPEAGPGGFVVFAAEAAQYELTYARNNPLKYVDPDGKDEVLVGDKVVTVFPGGIFVMQGAGAASGDATHVSMYGWMDGSSVMGIESTSDRNAFLTLSGSDSGNRTIARMNPDNTGDSHEAHDLFAKTVNGRPNPNSPANGAVLLGVIQPAGLPATPADVKAAGETIKMFHFSGGKQCTNFVVTAVNFLGQTIPIKNTFSLAEFAALVRKAPTSEEKK